MSSRGGRLPDFLIIGAMKAGTTSLFMYLKRHPLVWGPRFKEVHFFDWQWGRGVDWYRHQFETADREQIVGEASPFYIFHPLVPERVRAVVPEVRLLAILRDPVDRAISHYHHEVRHGVETRPMKEAFERQVDDVDNEPDPSEFDSPTAVGVRSDYIRRGLYAQQLSRWFDRFEPTQVSVFETSALTRRGADWARALDALHLPSLDAPQAEHYSQEYEPAPRETRRLLADFYAPHNDELFSLLGTEYEWKRP